MLLLHRRRDAARHGIDHAAIAVQHQFPVTRQIGCDHEGQEQAAVAADLVEIGAAIDRSRLRGLFAQLRRQTACRAFGDIGADKFRRRAGYLALCADAVSSGSRHPGGVAIPW
tara:strand:+ start:433 stop:771 length:339 start_codon:yes stop_codon:yes gene_type:complete